MKARHARYLDAAGITEPSLRAAFEECRVLHAGFGRSYYLATQLLPPGKRPYVNALYGFARYADEIVDNGPAETRARDLIEFSRQTMADLAQGDSTHPVLRALLHTLRRWDIDQSYVEAFLDSMLMDLTITAYPTYADLEQYMYGSAAVIGLQMTPILGPLDPEAHRRARALGEAFQLTNFIRDIAEDLARGRVYLPQEDLEQFGVSQEDLARGKITPSVRALLRFEVARTRDLYAYAEGGIAMVEPASRDCLRTAFELYGGILGEIEKADYQVFRRRLSVGLRRRAAIALPRYLHARQLWPAASTGLPTGGTP